MEPDTRQRAAAKLSKSKVHWSVHVVDKTANVVIRVGGLMVVFAVIGLIVFIFSQVLPLFETPDSGELKFKVPSTKTDTVALHTEEYRRVAVRVCANGELQLIAVPTGEVMDTQRVEDLDGATVTAAQVSPRPYARDTVMGVQDVPRYSLTLGLSDGRVLQGYISYVHTFKRFELNQDPESWRKLRQPEREEFAKPDYVPDVLIAKEEGRSWLVEHLAEFGFYRKTLAQVNIERELDIATEGEPVERVYSSLAKGGPNAEREALTTVITAKGRVLLLLESIAFNEMSGKWKGEELYSAEFTDGIKGRARFCLSGELQRVAFIGTDAGLVYECKRSEDDSFEKPDAKVNPPVDVFAFYSEKNSKWGDYVSARREELELGKPQGELKLTAMNFLLGESTVLFGDSFGGVQGWFAVRETEDDNNPRLRRIHVHGPGAGAISGFAGCESSKAFAVWDKGGLVRSLHNTSERELFRERIAEPGLGASCFGSRAHGVLGYDGAGQLRNWWIDSKYSEISFRALFGKVWYEGYSEPKYEWQTSSGTDDVEPKMSMTPLIVGTLKGGLYALLFAIPLAVLGALYTSEFMHRGMRSVVKPTMEVMASLPSVVLGFLGALYFAPMAAPIMPTIVVLLIIVPGVYMLFGWVWQQLPPTFTGKFGPRSIIALLLGLLVVGVLLASVVGPRMEQYLFPAREGANPALLDSKSFLPVTEDAARRLDAGDFRSWTNGGAELPRPLKAGTTELPKGWWIPGGHNLFILLMFIPISLLVGWSFKALGAFLFGGKATVPRGWPLVAEKEFPGVIKGGNPLDKLRQRIAGQSGTTLWPVAIDVGFSLCFVALAGLIGFGLSSLISPALELLLFGYTHPTAGHVADFRRFVTGPEGWKFNQTNSLVVGLSMGFAVIPIIYSIAEDALSAVPNQLRAASLACGASRWQTAVRVVMPAAASGIFSAIVIGLGRAIGETMIVVMAAGGTPVMEMEPLSGFRSLAAAIAIEMPEAPHGGSHYRTLFLGGLILFAMTFVISTMAEVVRQRLRKKLSRM